MSTPLSPEAASATPTVMVRQPGGLALKRDASLVPSASIAGRSLVTVIAIMTFLCGLAAGGGLMIAAASQDWNRSVATEATIQIRPVPGRDVAAEVEKAAALARSTEGIAGVEVYDQAASEKLLEPWLGNGLNLADLPVPRMVALRLDRSHAPDLVLLRQRLQSSVSGVSLDDHQAWAGWLSTMAHAVVAIAASIFCLVVAAMFMTVAFATRGAMAGNNEIIRVLHFVGAEDRFIAREFQSHFLRLGFKGGVIGGGCAILLFTAVGLLSNHLQATAGGEQMEALFGTFALGFRGYAAIVAVTVAIALATGLISRVIVFRNLRRLS